MNDYLLQNIRYLRRKHMWSQYRLAKKVGCNIGTVKNWEIGRNYPTYLLMLRLEEVFKVSLDDLSHRNMEAE